MRWVKETFLPPFLSCLRRSSRVVTVSVRKEVAVGIERSYNKVERTRNMVQVANQVVKLRQESERLAQNQLTEGVILVSQRRQATAASYKAQADYLQASLGYLLAWAELEQAAGRTPGL